mgnify:CR=1 FL=1
MNIIDKVTNSRGTLKEILSGEWNTNTIPELSNIEIEKIYNIPSSKNKSIAQFGIASGCNFSLEHRFIKPYKLHIIYYNFPEIGRNSSKVTKSICDKLKSLYISELISPYDSIFVIINDNISPSLEESITELNINLQNDLESIELSDSIIQEMKENNFPLEKKHFRNITLLDINSITNNLLKHRLIPAHKAVRDKKSIKEILEKCNCTVNQLPIILKNDTVSKYLRLSPGDICEITRTSIKVGKVPFYRICR